MRVDTGNADNNDLQVSDVTGDAINRDIQVRVDTMNADDSDLQVRLFLDAVGEWHLTGYYFIV